MDYEEDGFKIEGTGQQCALASALSKWQVEASPQKQ
jgi:hypothetical protein